MAAERPARRPRLAEIGASVAALLILAGLADMAGVDLAALAEFLLVLGLLAIVVLLVAVGDALGRA